MKNKNIKERKTEDESVKEASDKALRQNYAVLNLETMQHESRIVDIFQISIGDVDE